MKRQLMLIPLVFLCCLGCQQGAEVVEQPISTQTEEERTNLRTYQLWDEEVWGKGKLELVKELVAPEYIMHEAMSDWVVTPEQYTEEIREYQKDAGSRDFVGKTQAISAKDDLVWVRSSGVATDPKIGNKGSVKVLKVYRFVNGKLTESWAIVINDQGPWPDFKL